MLTIYQQEMIRECLEDHGITSSKDCDSIIEFIEEILEDDENVNT